MIREIPYNNTNNVTDTNDKIVDVTIFLYLIGLCCFKSGSPIDALLCRALFVIMVTVVFFSKDKRVGEKKYYCLKCYACFFAFYFFSFIWGNIEDGMYYINNIIEIMGDCYVFGKRINSKERLLKYLKYLLLSIVGMVFLIMLRKGVSDYSDLRQSSASDIGLNINDVGYRCCIGMMIAVLFASKKPYYYLICVLTSVYALLSGSKKVLFLMCSSIMLYVILKFKGSKRFLYLGLSVAIVAIVLYLVFTIPILYELLGYRLYKFYLTAFDDSRYFAESGNMIVDNSYEYRIFFKEKAMEMFFEKPIWGYGANVFSSRIEKYIGLKTYSHCNYTELLSTLGISGLLLYYLPFFYPLVLVVKEIKKRDDIIIYSIIIITSKFFLDYENVSYISVFNNLIIIMACEYIINTYTVTRSDENDKTEQSREQANMIA